MVLLPREGCNLSAGTPYGATSVPVNVGFPFTPVQHTYPRNPLPQVCRITSFFDASRYVHAHHAQDLVFDNGNGGKTVPPYGTPVTAMEAGVVYAVKTGYGPAASQYPQCQGAPGNFVAIRVPGDPYYTIYFHMSAAAGITVVTPIYAGEVIGYLDNSGCQTAAHLHVGRKAISGNAPVNFTIPCINTLPVNQYDDGDGVVEDWEPDDELSE